MKELQEITKEKWEQVRSEAIRQARKLSNYGDEDIAYYYTNNRLVDWTRSKLKKGANNRWPVGCSKWTIRHFSPIGCHQLITFSITPVTCLLRSPDGRHYVSEHLPGFCPIHHLIPASEEAK